MEEHLPRLTDVDEKAADRATRQVATMFGLVPILADRLRRGLLRGPGDAYIDFGPLHANAQHLLPRSHPRPGAAAHRHGRRAVGPPADGRPGDGRLPARRRVHRRGRGLRSLTELNKGIDESQLTRRKVIGRSLIGALAALGLPVVVGLADLGPWPTKKKRAETIERTIWAPGIRLVNDVTFDADQGRGHRDRSAGQRPAGEPPGSARAPSSSREGQGSIIVVRMDPNTIKIPDSRQDWQVGGILCYSKICTHVGCPISLWEQQTHHLLCPCHQSTFDLGNSGVVVFGPATRALPQLPITTDAEGYLVAQQRLHRPGRPELLRAGLAQRLPARVITDGQASSHHRATTAAVAAETPPKELGPVFKVAAGPAKWADERIGDWPKLSRPFYPQGLPRPLVLPAR